MQSSQLPPKLHAYSHLTQEIKVESDYDDHHPEPQKPPFNACVFHNREDANRLPFNSGQPEAEENLELTPCI